MSKVLKACPSDPLRVRRQLAILIIFQLELVMFALLAMAYWGGPNVAAILTAASGALLALITGLLGLAGAWYHAAYRAPT